MKVLISQPMKGLTTEEINKNRKAVVEKLEAEGHEVIDSVFEDFQEANFKNIPLAYLAKSLELIAKEADQVVFMKGWRTARGCILEHQCCLDYGVKVLYL
ncbi:DUF4406 domain-containing protein [Desulfovibrio litoralis]|uniref:DUF4406 domain-containing protein n=1 Tax=Desulfovibrio litoralis DSM 11393 TaxID=1121455 RepID=A0A1M7T7W5_9BACT|nr:DUF4406 domain-containing protein [Desulfovibrio litoralis]SHN66804.1 protein of unknown function [Desulfovibrio litoralis DSM 11393]